MNTEIKSIMGIIFQSGESEKKKHLDKKGIGDLDKSQADAGLGVTETGSRDRKGGLAPPASHD